jgi:hypothetical protein
MFAHTGAMTSRRSLAGVALAVLLGLALMVSVLAARKRTV